MITSEAITALQQIAFEGRWGDAPAVIEEAKALLTEPDAELLIWKAVVHDKLGQSGRAQEALAEAKALVPSDGQETIAHETGLHKTQVWRAANGLEKKGLYTRVKKPYRDARGRVRAGKIHHYEFAEVVERALEYAGQAFNEDREAERNGRLPEKELTGFAEGGRG